MILTIEEARELLNLDDWNDNQLERKLAAIEQAIRSYTNNNFQDRKIRMICQILDGYISGYHPALKVGDAVQINESMYNDGLYVITGIDTGIINLNKNLTAEESGTALLTAVKYPDDVRDCALNLLTWEKEHRSKVGVKSETLSRHSITYYDQDASNQVMGYPVSLMGGLAPYRKARF